MHRSSTILIADDKQNARDLLASILAGPDYHLLFARNGKEAVDEAARHNPDLVLLDILMPEMDGFEVCRRLRSDPRTKELPIIIITGLHDHRSRLLGIQAGADDFITKPFDMEELQARVRSIVRLNRYRTLLSERAKFERLFELSPDGIIIADLDQTVILANPALLQMIDARDESGPVNKPISSLIAPDQATSFCGLLTAAPDKPIPSLVETVFIRRDGTRLPVEISTGDVLYDGQPALYLIIRDITERKSAEENLRESEKKYRDLVENIEDIIYIMDGHGVILFVNDAMERSFAYPKQEIIGRRFTEFLAPEDRRFAEELFRRQLVKEDIGAYELSFIKKDGRRVTLEIRERLIWDDHTVIEVHGIGRDITERKRIQEELRKTDERLATLFKTSKDVVFICDARGRFTDINPAGEQLLGRTREELLTKTLKDICIDPQAYDHFTEIISRDGYVKDYELTLAGETSMPIDCWITATQTNDHHPDGVGFQGIIRDITEKKRFVDLTLDGINDGIFTVDGDWRIGYVNSAAEEIIGITRQESIGKKFFDVFHPDRHEDEEMLSRIMESNRQIIQKKITLVDAEGAKIPISLSAAVLSDRNGVITGAVMIFRDLSAIEALKKEIQSSYTFEDIISKNRRIKELFSILPYIAESGSNVLIEGKSGTGKELFSRAIHNLSPQKDGPFVAINCSAIPDTLLESELFGYVKGAFTNAMRDKPGRFALAEGGTLFLDEIGDLSKTLQVKLLRVLEEREYEPLGAVISVKTNARIIASTNRNLAEEIKKGDFREDLFYRLNVLKISIPALRERREDIPLLVEHFLEKFSRQKGKTISMVSDEVMDFLMGYDFPGNVREMENIIEHAFVLCRHNVILMEHLPKELFSSLPGRKSETALKSHVMDSEKDLIKTILTRYGGDRSKAALALNIGRTSLWRKMKKYHLI